MMIFLGIAAVLIVLLIVLSACRMASIADRDMELEDRYWNGERPEKGTSE